MRQPYDTAKMLAIREGRSFFRCANDFTCNGNLQIITLADAVFNLKPRHVVYVTGLNYGIINASKDCHFELVRCSAAGGGGVATAITCHYFTQTGTTPAGRLMLDEPFATPRRVRYTDGVRSIALRLHAKDAATIIEAGWTGWFELGAL